MTDPIPNLGPQQPENVSPRAVAWVADRVTHGVRPLDGNSSFQVLYSASVIGSSGGINDVSNFYDNTNWRGMDLIIQYAHNSGNPAVVVELYSLYYIPPDGDTITTTFYSYRFFASQIFTTTDDFVTCHIYPGAPNIPNVSLNYNLPRMWYLQLYSETSVTRNCDFNISANFFV